MDYNYLFEDVNNFKFTYSNTRGKKIWITFTKVINRNEFNDPVEIINGLIELNIIDNVNKLCWISYDNNKTEFITVNKDIKQQLIDKAIECITDTKYLNNVLKKYNRD